MSGITPRGWTVVRWVVAVNLALVPVVAAGIWTRSHAAPRTTVLEDDSDAVKVLVDDGDEGEPEVYIRKVEAGDPKGAYMGVSLEEDTEGAEGGARVESITDGSPAQKAGISRGDVIVGFDGVTIRGPVRLTEKIRTKKPGDRVEVKLVRKDGSRGTVSVELGERPKTRSFAYQFGDESAPTPPGFDRKHLEAELENLGRELGALRIPSRHWRFVSERPRLGVELLDTTPELREHLGGTRAAGVLVGRVLPGTPAEKAGVKVGDLIVSVDGDGVRDAEGLIEALTDKEGKTISLDLMRDRKSVRMQIPIPKMDDEDEPTGPRAGIAPSAPTPPAIPAAILDGLREEARVARRLAHREAEHALQAAASSQREAMRLAEEELRRAAEAERMERERLRSAARRTV